MRPIAEDALYDVTRYPPELLQIVADGVRIPVTYKKTWDDGFGARGWKINATLEDPEIIASTRETGQRINTSVFIHDILDHFVSGFGVSGHRSEAMALIQLSKRTGSDPRPDYTQMVKEDIINGRVNGESLKTFLPPNLYAMLPSDKVMTDKEVILFLQETLGEARLFESLVENFFTRGKAGEAHADESWRKLGLEPGKRTEIGLALQALLDRADDMAETSGVESLTANITVSNDECILNVQGSTVPQPAYSAKVA